MLSVLGEILRGAALSPLSLEVVVKHSVRKPVNKGKSAYSFRKQAGTTHIKNAQLRPLRGGWRL